MDGAVPLDAAKLSLPERGCTFNLAHWVDDDLQPFLYAQAEAMEDPVVAELASAAYAPRRPKPEDQYPPTVARLWRADMVDNSKSELFVDKQ